MPSIVTYLPTVGGWGIVGFGVGFALRKIGKYLVVFAGVYAATLLYLDHLDQKGIIAIKTDLGSFTKDLSNLLATKLSALWTATAISLPVIGAFAVGALLGFRKS